jgi:hypothetical protein
VTTKSTTKNGTTTSTTSGGSTRASAAASKATAGNTYVYATRQGSYYHLNSSCGGMTGASRITLKTAIKAGKKACPTCASAANRIVYPTSGGKNYHAARVCKESGMKKGEPRTLAQALMLNQTACPYCLKRNSVTPKVATNTASASTIASIREAAAKLKNSHTYKSGKSGIKVYARADGKYYHRRSNCSGMTNASRITLETAMNYGKKPCPACPAAERSRSSTSAVANPT